MDADPARHAKGRPVDGVACPFCDSRDTQLVSPFGGQLSVSQYWCRSCRTGFDYMKWEAHR
jgi:ring-1,2-phenylacetyl-CoA epoxidase subunit PaaD